MDVKSISNHIFATIIVVFGGVISLYRIDNRDSIYEQLLMIGLIISCILSVFYFLLLIKYFNKDN